MASDLTLVAVGVISAGAALLASEIAGRRAARQAATQREHDDDARREDREWAQRVDTYQSLIELALWQVTFMQRTRPIYEPSPPAPDEPPYSVMLSTTARVSMFGSERFLRVVNDFRTVVIEFDSAVWLFDRAAKGSDESVKLHLELNRCRTRANALCGELQDVAKAELQHSPPAASTTSGTA
jgi:hypothetical protein